MRPCNQHISGYLGVCICTFGPFFFGVLEVFVTIDRTTDDVANGGDALAAHLSVGKREGQIESMRIARPTTREKWQLNPDFATTYCATACYRW